MTGFEKIDGFYVASCYKCGSTVCAEIETYKNGSEFMKDIALSLGWTWLPVNFNWLCKECNERD